MIINFINKLNFYYFYYEVFGGSQLPNYSKFNCVSIVIIVASLPYMDIDKYICVCLL